MIIRAVELGSLRADDQLNRILALSDEIGYAPPWVVGAAGAAEWVLWIIYCASTAGSLTSGAAFSSSWNRWRCGCAATLNGCIRKSRKKRALAACCGRAARPIR